MDIKLATQNHGSNQVYIKGPQEYEPRTVEEMRETTLQRAKQTLKHLKAYEGGTLTSPMAKSGLNCIKVKIGYGKRNAALFDYDDGANERRLNADTVEERRSAAIEIIKDSIDSIKEGGMDEHFAAFLVTRRTSSKNGTKKLKNKSGLKLVPEKEAV
jgi:hypothetical protein